MTALSGPDRDQLRQQLAEVAYRVVQHTAWSRGVALLDSDRAEFRDRLAAALLPVVEAHTRAARADELEQAALQQDTWQEFWDAPRSDYGSGRHDAHEVSGHYLRTRAEALRTHEGDTDG